MSADLVTTFREASPAGWVVMFVCPNYAVVKPLEVVNGFAVVAASTGGESVRLDVLAELLDAGVASYSFGAAPTDGSNPGEFSSSPFD